MLKLYAKHCILLLFGKDADVQILKSFQLRRKNVNVFVRTQKPTKVDKNEYCVFPPLVTLCRHR